MYTVDFFIDKFSKIPEHLWLIGDQGHFGGPACAFGHCRIRPSDKYGSDTEEGVALQKLFFDSGLRIKDSGYGINVNIAPNGSIQAAAWINNGFIKEYQQPTPKQRILAALYDIKRLQSKVTEQQPKERIVYVSVPVSITEQAKDLITN
jgi:hypothetical protein